jgi:predicted transcriptional regulator
LMEEKGRLRHETDGAKYVYMPTLAREKARRSALKRMVQTFFDGSTELAVAALLSKAKLKQDELDRLSALIEQARKEGR